MVEFTGALDYSLGAKLTSHGPGTISNLVIMIDNDGERIVRLDKEVKGNVFSLELGGKKIYMAADESYVKIGFDYLPLN